MNYSYFSLIFTILVISVAATPFYFEDDVNDKDYVIMNGYLSYVGQVDAQFGNLFVRNATGEIKNLHLSTSSDVHSTGYDTSADVLYIVGEDLVTQPKIPGLLIGSNPSSGGIQIATLNLGTGEMNVDRYSVSGTSVDHVVFTEVGVYFVGNFDFVMDDYSGETFTATNFFGIRRSNHSLITTTSSLSPVPDVVVARDNLIVFGGGEFTVTGQNASASAALSTPCRSWYALVETCQVCRTKVDQDKYDSQPDCAERDAEPTCSSEANPSYTCEEATEDDYKAECGDECYPDYPTDVTDSSNVTNPRDIYSEYTSDSAFLFSAKLNEDPNLHQYWRVPCLAGGESIKVNEFNGLVLWYEGDDFFTPAPKSGLRSIRSSTNAELHTAVDCDADAKILYPDRVCMIKNDFENMASMTNTNGGGNITVPVDVRFPFTPALLSYMWQIPSSFDTSTANPPSGVVRALQWSDDGSTLYVGGTFVGTFETNEVFEDDYPLASEQEQYPDFVNVAALGFDSGAATGFAALAHEGLAHTGLVSGRAWAYDYTNCNDERMYPMLNKYHVSSAGVYDLALAGGKLYIVGDFTYILNYKEYEAEAEVKTEYSASDMVCGSADDEYPDIGTASYWPANNPTHVSTGYCDSGCQPLEGTVDNAECKCQVTDDGEVVAQAQDAYRRLELTAAMHIAVHDGSAFSAYMAANMPIKGVTVSGDMLYFTAESSLVSVAESIRTSTYAEYLDYGAGYAVEVQHGLFQVFANVPGTTTPLPTFYASDATLKDVNGLLLINSAGSLVAEYSVFGIGKYYLKDGRFESFEPKNELNTFARPTSDVKELVKSDGVVYGLAENDYLGCSAGLVMANVSYTCTGNIVVMEETDEGEFVMSDAMGDEQFISGYFYNLMEVNTKDGDKKNSLAFYGKITEYYGKFDTVSGSMNHKQGTVTDSVRVFIFNPNDQTVSPLPIVFDSASSTSNIANMHYHSGEKSIYITGGFTLVNGEPCANFMKYDLEADTFTCFSDIALTSGAIGASTLDGDDLVMIGYDDGEVVGAVESGHIVRFDVKTEQFRSAIDYDDILNDVYTEYEDKRNVNTMTYYGKNDIRYTETTSDGTFFQHYDGERKLDRFSNRVDMDDNGLDLKESEFGTLSIGYSDLSSYRTSLTIIESTGAVRPVTWAGSSSMYVTYELGAAFSLAPLPLLAMVLLVLAQMV